MIRNKIRLGQNTRYIFTEAHEKQAENLGLLDSKTAASELIEILMILAKNEVNLRKIEWNEDLVLKDIKQNHIDIQRIIIENNLNSDYPIGKIISNIRANYNNIIDSEKCSYIVTEEELRILEHFGIIKKKISEMAKTLYVLKTLSENGVDLTKEIIWSERHNGKQEYKTLGEINQDGVDIQGIIKKKKLNPEFSIGRRVTDLISSINAIRAGKKPKYPVTEEEIKLTEEIGVVRLSKQALELINAKKERNSAKDGNDRAKKLEAEVTSEFNKTNSNRGESIV